MTECPICKSEIKLNRLGRKTVEIICTCQGDNYLIASGSDDDLMRQYVDKVSKNESPAQTPKKIIGGVNLDNSLPMMVPYNFSSIFPGNLIHGAAVNHSNNKIRFSVDFRILPKSAYNDNLSKQFHITSGKPYFEAL